MQIAEGAMNGLQSALAIGASLIAIIGLVALVNGVLGIFGITLQQIFSYIFSPIGFLMGLDGAEILRAGQLLGEKLVLNEFVAFQTLGEVIQTLDYRTGLVMAISLLWFCKYIKYGNLYIRDICIMPRKKKSPFKISI